MATDPDDQFESEHSPPDISKIARLIGKGGKLETLQGKMDKSRGEIGTVYTEIEDKLNGNKKAVKVIIGLLKGSEAAAHDFMRTFEPLAEFFKLFPPDDLADLAAGTSAKAKEPAAPTERPPADDRDLALDDGAPAPSIAQTASEGKPMVDDPTGFEASDEEIAAQKGRPKLSVVAEGGDAAAAAAQASKLAGAKHLGGEGAGLQ